MRRHAAVDEQALHLLKDWNGLRLEISRRRGAGAQQIDQLVMAVGDEVSLARRLPIGRARIVRDDPEARRIDPLRHNAETRAQLRAVECLLSHDGIDLAPQTGHIELRLQ